MPRITRSLLGAPLYWQIANDLESQLSANAYPPGTLMPAEKALAARYGVSLITIRGAMRALVDKGLIARHPGKGTLVLEPRVRAVWELGWIDDLVTTILPSRLKLVSMNRALAPSWVYERLGLRPMNKVHTIRTVRFALERPTEPFMTSEIYHPSEIGERLRVGDFDDKWAQGRLVISLIEKKCAVSVTEVRQTMDVATAEPRTSRLLKIPIGHPLLVVTRDYFADEGRIVQTGRTSYRTDHYQYVLHLSRAKDIGKLSRRMPWTDNVNSTNSQERRKG